MESDESRLLVSESSKMYLYILTFCSALGGFIFGYDTGVISGALVLLEDPEALDLSSFQAEMVVSATIAGAIVGSMAGDSGNFRYGRRGVIILSSLIFTMGSILMGIAASYGSLLFGRFVVGLAVGLSSMTIPMYIAEVSPPKYRGTMVSINTSFITGGQFSASIVDGLLSKTDNGWRYMLGLAAVPAMVQTISFLFLPESPRWLVAHDKVDQAEKVLKDIRNEKDVREELEGIREDVKMSSSMSLGSHVDINSPGVRRALVLGCMLQALQQLSGINTVMYYSATIIQMAGFTDDSNAIWLSAIVSFSNFAFTILGIYLVDRMGRRRLTIYSLTGVTISLLFMGMSFFLAEFNSTPVAGSGDCHEISTCFDCVSDPRCGFCPRPTTNSQDLCIRGNVTYSGQCPAGWNFSNCPGASRVPGWIILISLFTYLACFAPGMGPMPWTINSEIFPLQVRSKCISITTSVNWICNLIVASTFLTLTRTVTTYGAFWIYACIAVLGIVYLKRNLPETKGVPLEDIERLFLTKASESSSGIYQTTSVEDDESPRKFH